MIQQAVLRELEEFQRNYGRGECEYYIVEKCLEIVRQHRFLPPWAGPMEGA